MKNKNELCVEVVINQKRELFDFKTDLAKEFWVKAGKLELLGCFEECVAYKIMIVIIEIAKDGNF